MDEGSGYNEGEDDYYSNFARRVYYIAEAEQWDTKKTMKYFNDRQAFEKYYTNVSSISNAPFRLKWDGIVAHFCVDQELFST